MADHLIAAARRARAATTPRQMHAMPSASGLLHGTATHDRDAPSLAELKLLDDAGEEFVSVYSAGWLALVRSTIRAGFARIGRMVR